MDDWGHKQEGKQGSLKHATNEKPDFQHPGQYLSGRPPQHFCSLLQVRVGFREPPAGGS